MSAKNKTSKKKKQARVPYHRKPENMTPEGWQIALRKQFAADHVFHIQKLGEHPLYTDFMVSNPASENSYKVAIRSTPAQIKQGSNRNFCACYDFKTNRLGTCKHIEAVLGTLHRNTRLRKYFKLEEAPQPPYSSVSLHYGAEAQAVRLRIGSHETAAFEALAKDYFSAEGQLLDNAFAQFEHFLSKAKEIDPEFRCYEDALLFILEQREQEWREQVLHQKIGDIDSPYFENLIKAKLFPYQKEGIWFAANAGRSMIADEMGLGKTIQALAVAELFKKELHVNQVLIVCPTSLKYQWKAEIEKFTDSKAHVVEGNLIKRAEQYKEVDAFYKIIGYHTVGRDLEAINNQEFDLVILDEAQRIKNWKTKTAGHIKQISSPYALVLTGTPLENKLEELYSIIQFINPFLLGSLYNFLRRYQVTDPETEKVIGYQHLNEVGERLKHVMIRRQKKQVLKQLPHRQDKNLLVPMTERQRDLHDEYQEMVAKLVHKWRRMGFLPEKDRQRLMIGMNMMRMSCNSSYIIDQKTRHDTKIDELMGIMEEVLSVEGNKMVVFSQWERMTRLVALEMDKLGIEYSYLHGGVPSSDRGQLLVDFRENPDCKVFLSTDAGGTGLNLQAASYLVNLDIPWNPAILEQRIARVYRMGQENAVSIINLVSSNTIEHRMLDVLRFKTSMFKGVLDQGDDAIFMSESRFNQFMKSVDEMTQQSAESTYNEGTISDEEAHEEDELAMPMQGVEEAQQSEEIAPEADPRQSQGHSTQPQQQEEEKESGTSSNTSPNGASNGTSYNGASGGGASTQSSSPQQLVSQGISFLSQLGQTLKSPKATQELVASITEKDKKTGQTYLKIPIESQETVNNALQVLGSLFGALGGK